MPGGLEAREPGDTGRFRWQIVRLLVLVTIFLYVDRANITIAAPSLVSEFRLTPAHLGRILSAFLFGYAIGLIPGGFLADRVGPHRLITAATGSWGVVTILMGCLPAIHPGSNLPVVQLLFVLRFLLGLCEACALPTINRALANWMLKRERASASGWVHCGAGLGGALTPLLIALVIGNFGWRIAFLASGAGTLIVSVIWWLLAADEPGRHPKVSAAETAAVLADREGSSLTLPGLSWYRNVARSLDAWLLCASMFCFGVAQFVYITWFYTYFVKVRGAAELNAALFASMPYAAIAIGSPIGGALADFLARRFGATRGRRFVTMTALILAGVSASIAPTISANLVSAAFFAAAAGLQYAAAPIYWSTVIDLTRQGAGILGGFMNASGYIGSALATVLFPYFADRIGWTLSTQYAAIAAVLASLLWLGIDARRQLDRPRPAAKPDQGLLSIR